MAMGRIAQFDERRGLGTVTTSHGATLPFQCLAIADGSRAIAVGAEVTFDVVAKLGRYEAWNIRLAATEG